MCKWEATLFRCKHFTLRITEPCVHGAGHPDCLGVDQLLFVLKKQEFPTHHGEGRCVLDWCPYRCGTLIGAGQHGDVVARSQTSGSGETDMEMLNKIYLLAGHGEEVKEGDYVTGEGGGVGFGDFLDALTVGISRWEGDEGT